jgi:hypothetical protein
MDFKDIKEKNNQSKIYVLSGKSGHGKDACGDIITNYYEKQGLKVVKIPFAKYIKQYFIDYFGWDGTDENKPREPLQIIGTDIIRQKLNMPNFHVNRVCEDIEILSYFFDVIIIPDCRFLNEIEIPRFNFGFDRVKVIRMVRDNYVSKLTKEQQEHISECELDTYMDFDYVIHAENLEDMGNH